MFSPIEIAALWIIYGLGRLYLLLREHHEFQHCFSYLSLEPGESQLSNILETNESLTNESASENEEGRG